MESFSLPNSVIFSRLELKVIEEVLANLQNNAERPSISIGFCVAPPLSREGDVYMRGVIARAIERRLKALAIDGDQEKKLILRIAADREFVVLVVVCEMRDAADTPDRSRNRPFAD